MQGTAAAPVHVNAPLGAGSTGAGKLLTGKKALVTGASRGIGRAISIAFAQEGATLILSARNVQDLQDTAKACTAAGADTVHIAPSDCCSMALVDKLTSSVLEQYGPVDILVCNAGMATRSAMPESENIWQSESPLEGSPDAWSSVLALNLETPMRLTRAFAPYMAAKKEGIIINIASIAGIDRMARAPVYCASKWGLRGWSKCCYEALRPHGIKVALISPGLVDTPMTSKIEGDRTMFIQPEDIAQAALLCCRMSANAVPEEIVVRTTLPISVAGLGDM